jgi:hypothetical protein
MRSARHTYGDRGAAVGLAAGGVLPALTVVAGLFADLDLAAITDNRSDVERAFIDGGVGALQPQLKAELDRSRTIFSNVALVQCIKEIVEFADEDSERELSVLDLTRCVLGANQDNDKIDAGIMARATNPGSQDATALRADFLELALDFVAQGMFDHSDTFETLTCSVDETWRHGWAPGTPQKVIHDFGAGPADVCIGHRCAERMDRSAESRPARVDSGAAPNDSRLRVIG